MSAKTPAGELGAVLDLMERPALLLSVDGEILFANAAAERFLGRPRSELGGEWVSDVLELEDVETFGSLLRDVTVGNASGETGWGNGGRPRVERCRMIPVGAPPTAVVFTWSRSESTAPPAGSYEDPKELAHSLRQSIQVILGHAELLVHGFLGPLDARQQEAARRVSHGILELERRLCVLLRRLAERDS